MHRRALFCAKHETVLRASLVIAAAVAFSAIVIALVAMPTGALAQTRIWTGTLGSDWNTPANWSPFGVPAATDAVVFNAIGAGAPTPSLTANSNAASLLFDAGATSYILSAFFSLSGVSAVTVSDTTTGTQTINLSSSSAGSLLFPSGQDLTITNNAALTAFNAPTLVLSSNTVIGTPGIGGVVFGGAGTTTFSGSFADSSGPNNQVVGGLTKAGPGIVTLSGNGSNLTGGIRLTGGMLRLDYSTNAVVKFAASNTLTSAGGELVLVPNAGAPVTQNANGTSLTAGHTTVVAGQLGADLTLGLGAVTRSAGATLNVLTLNLNYTTSTGNTNGLLGAGPAFATLDNGQWATASGGSLAGVTGAANNFSAGTNTDLTATGVVNAVTTNSLRFTTNSLDLSVNSGLTLQSGGILVPAGVTGSTISGPGVVTTSGGAGELLVHAYGPLTINSKLATSGGLTKTGPDTLTLGANNFNVGFTGPITVNRGGLRFTTSAAVGDASAIIFNDNAARGDGAQTLTLEHGDNLFSGMGFVSSIRFSASANGPNVFPNVITTGVNNNARVVINGVISSASGTVTPIRFDGQGNDSSGIILQGNNTFTGPVELRNGTLEIDSNANLGNPANPLFLNTGNALGGGLEFGAGGIVLARPVQLLSPARITSNGTDVNTISGPLSGSTFLFKAGTGTLAVTGPSTFNGELRIEAGTLRANAAFLAAAGPIKVRNAAVLSLSETSSLPAAGQIILGTISAGPALSTIDVAAGATFTVNGELSDESGAAATLVKTGSGLLVLNPSASTYSGGTTVRNGELRAAVDASLGAAAGPVTVEPAGALTFTGSPTTGRAYTLLGGSLGVAAGQAVTFANASVTGGFLVGPGFYATQSATTNTFIGNTTFTATDLTLSGTDSLTNFSNGGLLIAQSPMSSTLTRFTNTSSGRIAVTGTVQTSEFVSNGVISIPVGGLVNNTASNLVLGGGSRTFVGTAASPGGSINLSGGTTIELNGALLVNNGTINGTVNVNFGSLAKGSGVYGVVNVNQGGVYSPGNSPGISTAAAVTFDNSPTTSGAPILMMELAGTALGTGFDQLHVTGHLSLGGTLAVSLIGGFAPAAGDFFDILNWGTLSGTFSTISLPTLSGLSWNTSQLYSTGVLSLVAGLVGDYNQNGTVDAADYVVWRNNIDTTNLLPNDPIGGTIGDGQYDQWRSNFGQTTSNGAAAGANGAVLEPASSLLLCIVGILLIWSRRRAVQ